MITIFVLVRLWRRGAFRRREDNRGEYRAVAAQYMESAFDDGLTAEDYDVFSDEENDDDDAAPGWKQNGKRRSIEMMGIDEEMNGGLTLEEMNG